MLESLKQKYKEDGQHLSNLQNYLEKISSALIQQHIIHADDIKKDINQNITTLTFGAMTLTFSPESRTVTLSVQDTAEGQALIDYVSVNYPSSSFTPQTVKSSIIYKMPIVFAQQSIDAALGMYLTMDEEKVRLKAHYNKKATLAPYVLPHIDYPYAIPGTGFLDPIGKEFVYHCGAYPVFHDDNNTVDIWDIYMASKDLEDTKGKTLLTSFNKTLTHLRETETVLNRTPDIFTSEYALDIALKSGTYKGGWFIPTLSMLAGKTIAECKKTATTTSNMVAINKELPEKHRLSSNGSAHYYSCTPSSKYRNTHIHSIDIEDNRVYQDKIDEHKQKTRLVRAVKRKQPLKINELK